jgi:hypothetical protein
MAKLIVILGTQNSGKTTTAGMVYQELVKYANGAHVFNKKEDTVKDNLDYYANGSTKDFTAIIPIKTKKVGMVSEGDAPDRTRPEIEYLIKENVDVIVCCSRSVYREGSVYQMYVEEFANHRLVREIRPKYSENEKEKYEVKKEAVYEIIVRALLELID